MEEINLYKLIKFYLKNWLLIVSLTLTGLLGGLIYNNFIQTPLYKSNATILFINPAGRSTQDVTFINNYVQLFSSRRVIEPVIEQQKVNIPYETLVKSISATNDKGTEVIKLSVSTEKPELSQRFLRAAVISFKDQSKKLYRSDNLSVVDNASSAVPPYNVNKPLQLLLGISSGFIVSLIVLFFIFDIKGDTTSTTSKKSVVPKKKPTKTSRTNTNALINIKDKFIDLFKKNNNKQNTLKPKKVKKSTKAKATPVKSKPATKVVPSKKKSSTSKPRTKK